MKYKRVTMRVPVPENKDIKPRFVITAGLIVAGIELATVVTKAIIKHHRRKHHPNG